MNHWNYDYWILVLFNYSLAADLTQLEDGAERDFGWLSQMMKNHRLSVQKTLSHFRVIPASRSSRLPESAYESSDLPLKTEQSKIIIAYWLNFEDTRLSSIATRWKPQRNEGECRHQASLDIHSNTICSVTTCVFILDSDIFHICI